MNYRKPALHSALLVGALAAVVGTAPVLATTVSFTDVTAAAGVSFLHAPMADTPGLPMHGGATVGDFNNDGWPDLFVVGGGDTADRLFLNEQDGTFRDVAPQAGLTDLYRGNGAAAGDYNRDGLLDIFVTSFGDLPGAPAPGAHRLYRNNGDGTFTNVAAQAGANYSAPSNSDGYSPVWGDFNLDGCLDLWIGGWHSIDDVTPIYEGTRLLMNMCDDTFLDVTVPSGTFNDQTRGFSSIFADMDGDRYPELLVAGDFGTSRYYVNDRDGTFTLKQDILLPGTDKVHNGMGTAIADWNRDGLLDWFVTSIYPSFNFEGPDGNRLYFNEGDNQFRMAPESSGVNDGGWGWGALGNDFNHDGYADLFHTNGWPNCDLVTGECFENEQSYLWENNYDESFTEHAMAAGVMNFQQGRGAGSFDYDRDGDMDFFITSNAGDLQLFRNDLDLTANDTAWLQVKLYAGENERIAPNGRGTSVRVTAPSGAFQVMQMTGHSNYLAQSDLVVHFGLNQTSVLSEVNINWTDGFTTYLKDVAVNQILEVTAENWYSHTQMVRGQDVTLTVKGLREGEEAVFAGSNQGEGMGPCPPQAGGLCADVVSPIIFGTAIADADGVATLVFNVPVNTPFDEVWSQVMVARGENGEKSLKSNVFYGTVIDP